MTDSSKPSAKAAAPVSPSPEDAYEIFDAPEYGRAFRCKCVQLQIEEVNELHFLERERAPHKPQIFKNPTPVILQPEL